MDEQLTFGAPASQRHLPLAARMRPAQLSEIVGQDDLTGDGSPLRVAFESGQPHSCLFWGPPGTGKTTLALALASSAHAAFAQLNAVTDGIKELRAIIAQAQARHSQGEQTLLFIDEIARWSKTQQDALLPHVEAGTIILVGATTEHPAHQMAPALLSRLRVYQLQSLGHDALAELARRALRDVKRGVGIPADDERPPYSLTDEGLDLLLLHASGDARRMLGVIERAAALAPDGGELGVAVIEQAAGQTQATSEDEHYALASALIKSIRGSDPDAALYWLARMEAAGEDPLFIARRLIISASEEIGVAASGALAVAVSGMQACQMVGPPECWITLAHVAAYLARSPKSWASYQGLQNARELVRSRPHYPIPNHLRNPSTAVDRSIGHGKGYIHASKPGGDSMEFLPGELRGARIYRPSGNGQDRA